MSDYHWFVHKYGGETDTLLIDVRKIVAMKIVKGSGATLHLVGGQTFNLTEEAGVSLQDHIMKAEANDFFYSRKS